MSPINGKGETGSHERYSVPTTLSGRGSNPEVQLAILCRHCGSYWCGVTGSAVSAWPVPCSTFAGHCTTSILDDLIAAGVALCLRPLSALRSELGLLDSISDTTAMDQHSLRPGRNE